MYITDSRSSLSLSQENVVINVQCIAFIQRKEKAKE